MAKLSMTTTTVGVIMVPLLAGLISAIVFPANIMNRNIPVHVNLIKTDQIENELSNIQARSYIIAQQAKLPFEKAINFVRLSADYSTKVYSGEFNTSNPYSSYYSGPTPLKQVPPGQMAINLPMPDLSNSKYSAFFLRRYTAEMENDASLIAQLDNASHLTNVFRSAFMSTREYFGIYIGFETNGLWYSYPYFDLDGHSTKEFTCARTNEPIVGYDARCRGWYQMAYYQVENTYAMTEPYNDATTNMLMITITHKVFHPDGSLVGVIGIDLLIDTLASIIDSSRILERGYTFMIDEDQNIVVYPGKTDDSVETIAARELPTRNSIEVAEFDAIVRRMVNRETNMESYYKDGEKWYISYNPVDNTPYSIAVVVPESDIHAPANQLQADVDSSLRGFVIATVVIGTLIVILTLGTIIWHTRRIVGNIDDFDRRLEKMGKLNFEVETGTRVPASAEMRILNDGVGRLALSVKMGNDKYLSGKHDEAIACYEAMGTLMKQQKNLRGQGVCENNIASSMARQDHKSRDAERHFKNAISIGIQLKAFYESNGERKQAQVVDVIVGNRQMNLGSYYAKNHRFDEAATAFDRSLFLHNLQDNSIGKAKTWGAFGAMLIERGRIVEAHDMLFKAYEELRAQASNMVSILPLQYISFYYARVLVQQNRFDEAEAQLVWVTTGTQNCEMRLMQQAVRALSDCYYAQGKHDAATKLETLSGNITTGGHRNRYVATILDYSGSMKGAPLSTCYSATKDIVQSLGDSDHFMYTLFDTKVHPIIENWTKVGPNKDYILRKISEMTNPYYRTAFYAAINQTLSNVVRSTTDKETWVVALTDGMDNESSSGQINEMFRKLAQAKTMTLLIITLGEEYDAKIITRIINNVNGAASKKNGNKAIHLKAGTDTGDIRRVFGEVQAMIADFNIEKM